MTTTEVRSEISGAVGRPITARTFDGLERVPEEDWQGLVAHGSGTLGRGYLLAWERSDLPGLRSCPVLAYSPDRPDPVGACPGYFYDLDVIGVRVPAAAGVLRLARRFRPGLLMPRTYELGSPTPLTNPFLVGDRQLRTPIIKAMVDAALAEADHGGAQFVLVQNLTSLDGPAAHELMAAGFAGVPIYPTVVVDLPYRSFDDYLGAMRAQYRRRARQAFDRSRDLTVEHHQNFAGMAEELATLWRLIYERAKEVRREVLTPDFFRAASDLEDTSVLILRRSDGSVASFALLMADRPWLSFLQCGFDVRAARTEGAYFRLLYEIVRTGIEGGYEQVELGMTTLPPKLDIGGVPVPLFALVRHRNPVMQAAIRTLANGPMRPAEVSPRRVFKDPAPSAAELVARRELPD